MSINIDRHPKLSQAILADIERDEEIEQLIEKYKDKKLPPDEMHLKIQAERVIYVINRCLAKLDILAYLPHFLEDDEAILKKYFNAKEFYFIIEVLNNYYARINVEITDPKIYQDYVAYSIYLMNLQNPIKSVEKSTEQTPDPQVDQVMDLIFYNKCLKPVILSAVSPKTDSNVKKIVRLLNDFKNIVKHKLFVTGDEERLMDIKLRSAYKTNVLLMTAISDLQSQLTEQRKELGKQLNKTVEIFDMYNRKMEKIKEDFQIQMGKNLHESERFMMHKCLESEQIQEELAVEANKLVQQYESLLEENLALEKVSRSKRLKIETQLQNWLGTYDQDIGERQTEYETLKKVFDDKTAERDDLEKKMDVQEEEYDVLMEEKRVEEERIFNEMAYQFLLNRSARVIQKYWRAYKERKLARRKGRKASRPKITITRKTDPNAALHRDKKIKEHVFEDLKNTDTEAFIKKDLSVAL